MENFKDCRTSSMKNTQWLENEIVEIEAARKHIHFRIREALPALNGTLAYSILKHRDFLANHIIKNLETKGDLLRGINFRQRQQRSMDNFLEVLLGQKHQKGKSLEELLEMLLSNDNKYMVVIDHAEYISQQIMEWILRDTNPEFENVEVPKTIIGLLLGMKRNLSTHCSKPVYFL